MTDRPPRAFKIDDAGPRGAPGVSVHGEVDIDTVQELEVALDAAIRESGGAFTVDLSDVGFLDSSGLHAGRGIGIPVLVVVGEDETQLRDAPEVWRSWAGDLTVAQVPGGHFIPEEAPEQRAEILAAFLV